MRKVLAAITFAMLATTTTDAFAADPMGMSAPAPMATTSTYRFEVAGPVESHAGTSIVSIRLIHTADNKPVTGAIIIQSRADMGPIGMASMQGPIKALPVATPGIYPFEVRNGSVWSKPDKWALTFAAKVQGESATVNGTVIVALKP